MLFHRLHNDRFTVLQFASQSIISQSCMLFCRVCFTEFDDAALNFGILWFVKPQKLVHSVLACFTVIWFVLQSFLGSQSLTFIELGANKLGATQLGRVWFSFTELLFAEFCDKTLWIKTLWTRWFWFIDFCVRFTEFKSTNSMNEGVGPFGV